MADSNQILYELKIEENRALRSLKNVKEAVNSLDRRTTKYKNAVKEQVQLELQLAKIRKDRIQVNKQMESSVKNLTKAQVQQKNATGATTSAALELGRVIQDAPYGIRGMANNITQLVSQLGFAAKATGSWKAAIGGMISSLTGTLGIVFAMSVAVSALDYFFGANKKAEESTKDLTNELKEQTKTLQSYEHALNTSNLSLEERSGLIKAASVSNPEFLKLLKESSDAITEQESALKELIIEQENEIELKEKIAKLEKINQIIRDSEIQGIENLRDKISEYESVMSKIIQTEQTYRTYDTYKRKIDGILEVIKSYETQKELLQDINGLVGGVDNSAAKIGTEAYYVKYISDLKKIRKETANTAEEYKKQTTSIKTLQKELDKLRGKKDTEKKDRASVLGLEGIDPKKEAAKAKKILDLFKKYTKDLMPDGFIDFSKESKDGLTLISMPDEEDLAEARDALTKYLEMFKDVMGGVSDFLNGEAEREMTIEQNKTNALNAELNQRLLNEKLSESERKGIQQQIWQNDEKLRIKQDEIAKKKFNTQKAFNISMAIADSYLAGTRVLADPFFVGRPWERGIAMAATITSGLASVAAIARQKFQSSSAATPINTASSGGGSGGVGDRTFDFNLVGNNVGNQVSDAIQGQFDKPLKAYVVSKDITNQQQLDANTKSSARFGN